MKKLLAAILVATLLFSMLSMISCNRKGNNDSGVIKYAETTTCEIKDSSGKVLGVISYKAKGTDYAIITGYQSNITSLHSIVIPEVLPESERTVVEIGEGAFKACSYVTSIRLPATIEKIGAWAFSGCSALYEISIPANVASIENGAFQGCSSLSFVNFASEKSLLTKIGENVFFDCVRLESIALPEKLETIETGAFGNCKALKTVTLPDALTSIGDAVFMGCDAIESITFGSNVEHLGEWALGTLITDAPEVLVYPDGSTTDKTINNIEDEGEPIE